MAKKQTKDILVLCDVSSPDFDSAAIKKAVQTKMDNENITIFGPYSISKKETYLDTFMITSDMMATVWNALKEGKDIVFVSYRVNGTEYEWTRDNPCIAVHHVFYRYNIPYTCIIVNL